MPLSLRRLITCTDPWDVRSYRDNSIQSGLEHSLASPWPGQLLWWVGEHLASGQWMTAVSGAMFQGKEQRTLFLDFSLYNTTQRVQTLFISTMDGWSVIQLLCHPFVHGLSLEGKNMTSPHKRRKVGKWWFRQRASRDSGQGGGSVWPGLTAWLLPTNVFSHILFPSNTLSFFH